MIKLDLRDKKLLWELDQNSRQPTSQLAKKLRLPTSVVNYRISRLVREGIIKRFVTIIDYARLGVVTYKVYLQFQNLGKDKEEQLVNDLNKNPRINYVASYSGSWDLVFAIYARKIRDFDNVINDFLSKYSSFILNRVMSVLVEVEIYKRDYLLQKQGTAMAKFGGEMEETRIDTTDTKILKILQNNARTSVVEIAQKLNSTARIVAYRIKQLEKKGITIGYRIDLNHQLLGLEFYKAFIQTHNYTDAKDKSFRSYCRQLPKCLHLVKSIGNWDYELEFEVESYTEFNSILKEMRAHFGDFIKVIDTVLIEKEHKFEFL